MVKRPFRRRRRARRLLDLALAAAILGALALLAARSPFFSGPVEAPSGFARVGDGDSLAIGDARIRLEGIDAPELGQDCTRDGASYPCGREARTALARLVEGTAVACEGRRRDRYDRLLARCAARGIDLNRAMVEAGWAVSYGGYADAEAEARHAGRGIWAGSFERPQDWRRIHGGLAESAHGGLSGLVGWLRDVLSGMMQSGETPGGQMQ